MRELSTNKNQQGLAALVTAVVLLIAITIIVIFSAKFGVQELKIAANEARHKEAQQLADAAVEQAASFLRANVELYSGASAGWSDCTPVQSTFPCTVTFANQDTMTFDKVFSTNVGGALNTVDISTLRDTSTAVPTVGVSDGSSSSSYILIDDSVNERVTVLGVGVSKDGTAVASAKQEYGLITLVTPGEIPPVMAPQLNLNGNFTIVANPNNGTGTSGVPISGWTENETASGTGSWQTCNLGDFRDGVGGPICTDVYDDTDDWSGCLCTSSLSNKDEINFDIYEDVNFPDPLEYVFGFSDPDRVAQSIIDAGGKYYGVGEGCAGLDTLDLATLTVPMVFVEDDCTIPAVGSESLPVVLVVRGRATINASTDIWGLLISITEVKSNGAAIVHGSLVADGTADLVNGGYTQIYTPDLLEKLAEDVLNKLPGKVAYSWTDQITNLPN